MWGREMLQGNVYYSKHTYYLTQKGNISCVICEVAICPFLYDKIFQWHYGVCYLRGIRGKAFAASRREERPVEKNWTVDSPQCCRTNCFENKWQNNPNAICVLQKGLINGCLIRGLTSGLWSPLCLYLCVLLVGCIIWQLINFSCF